MTILSTLATIFGIIVGFANVPQIYKMFKTKSAKDISKLTYSILLIGAIIWIFYGFEIKKFPVIIMHILVTIEFIIILIGCKLYGGK
jgi:MtN3 and saliva related transmembrane protein